MKNKIALISIGLLNFIHASIHLIQFIQSLLLVSISHSHCSDETFIEHILHNPIINIIWAGIGLFTLYLGIKDFIHHKNCKHKNE